MGTFMAGTESVLAAEHVLVYKHQLGELLLVASLTQDSRTECRSRSRWATRSTLCSTRGPCARARRRCSTRQRCRLSTWAARSVGRLADRRAPLIAGRPAARVHRVCQRYVNVEAAFDDVEKDFALKLSRHHLGGAAR